MLRIQIKNKDNSEAIKTLCNKAELIKRTGLPVKNRMRDHLGAEQSYNRNQGLATFNIDESLLHLVPADSNVLIDGKRISIKQYKLDHYRNLILSIDYNYRGSILK